MLAAVPIKPFGVAKKRLIPVLDAFDRASLGKAVAARTLEVLRDAGSDVAVVTADPGVTAWAVGLGVAVIGDPDEGLDAAATAAVLASSGSWAIVHADLPIVTVADMLAVLEAVPEGGVALSPSGDGGTNVLAGAVRSFPFSYGPGSFSRHFAAARYLPHVVVSRAGLALDLDTPSDLEVARSLQAGDWSSP